jgi:hypothetical protein
MSESENNEKVNIAVIFEQLRGLTKKVDEISTKLDSQYVTKQEFWAVKTIVYSGAGLILTAVVVAVIDMVIRH